MMLQVSNLVKRLLYVIPYEEKKVWTNYEKKHVICFYTIFLSLLIIIVTRIGTDYRISTLSFESFAFPLHWFFSCYSDSSGQFLLLSCHIQLFPSPIRGFMVKFPDAFVFENCLVLFVSRGCLCLSQLLLRIVPVPFKFQWIVLFSASSVFCRHCFFVVFLIHVFFANFAVFRLKIKPEWAFLMNSWVISTGVGSRTSWGFVSGVSAIFTTVISCSFSGRFASAGPTWRLEKCGTLLPAVLTWSGSPLWCYSRVDELYVDYPCSTLIRHKFSGISTLVHG